jgi:CRISPR/Cas system-associated exonuclease Cas4 (RecB family)
LFAFSHIPSKSALLEFFNHHREKETKETSNIRTPEDLTPQEIKIRAEKYLSDYHDAHQNFESLETVETEKEMLFTLPNGQSFKGILDRLDFLLDGTIIINDYKTGKRLPTASDTGYVDQLSLYAYAIKQQYPQAKTIKARIIYLHFGIEDERKIQDEVLHTLVQTYQTYTSELKLKRQAYFQTKSPLPTQENSFCKYCEYQSSCPLRKHSFLAAETMSETDLRHLSIIDRFATVSKQLSEHKRQ